MARVKEHCENLASENGVIITEAQLIQALQKEIARLTAENARLIKSLEGCSTCKDQYEAEIKGLTNRLNKSRKDNNARC